MAARSVARAAVAIPEALRPTFVNNRWRSAKISARCRAKLRKEAVRAGTLSTEVTDRAWTRLAPR